jgi:hypothetical protein
MGTTAETVADRLGNDGSQFETQAGETLDALCRAAHASVERDGNDVLYEFGDGSAIIDSQGAGWDVRSPDCTCGWCWEGAETHCEERTGAES